MQVAVMITWLLEAIRLLWEMLRASIEEEETSYRDAQTQEFRPNLSQPEPASLYSDIAWPNI